MFPNYDLYKHHRRIGFAGVLILGILSILGSGGGGGGGGGDNNDTTPPITSADLVGGNYDSTQQVTLTANESATIYYSTDGVSPSPGAANTTTGSSPISGIAIIEGTTQLKFFAVDSAGNTESVNTETYIVDATPPNVAFTGGTPAPIGLLQNVNVVWQSDEDVTYVIELGGNGAVGSGIQVAAGSALANIPVNHSIHGWQLSFISTTEIWLYATDSFGHESNDFDSLALKATASIAVYGLWDFRINSTGTRAYVIDSGTNVKVLDIDTTSGNYNSVIATVTVGLQPRGLAITPDDSRVYVTNQNSNNISVIDTATNTVVTTVASGYSTPVGIDITPDGTRAYFTTWDGMIRVLDVDPGSVNYNTVIGNIILNILSLSGRIAITPDGTKAVVNWRGMIANAVDVIDVDPTSPFYNLPVGHPVPVVTGTVDEVITSPDSLSAYVLTGSPSCYFCRIDLSDYSLPDSSNSPIPTGIAITPDGNTVLAGVSAEEIRVLNSVDLTLRGSVPVTGILSRIIITPDGTRAYVGRSNLGSNDTVMYLLQ